MNNINFADDLTLVLGCIDLRSERHIEFPLVVTREFRERPIDELNLKVRSSNVLKRQKVFTFGQLMDRFDDIAHYRNCGETSVKEIKNVFLQTWYESVDSETRIAFWEEFIELNKVYR